MHVGAVILSLAALTRTGERNGFALILQLAPAHKALGRKAAIRDGGEHGAARLVSMGAIAKPTKRSELSDLGEQLVNPVSGFADIQRACAWRVDDPAAAGDAM